MDIKDFNAGIVKNICPAKGGHWEVVE